MHTFTVDAPDVSRAWLEACTRLSEIPGKRAFHTVVRIANPLQEDPHLRAELDRLRSARTKSPLYPIDTVVNTLFPAQLAATCTTHDELTDRYRAFYPRLRGVRRNAHGTYFGRLVAYPGSAEKPEPVDQLARVIRRLDKLRSSAKCSWCCGSCQRNSQPGLNEAMNCWVFGSSTAMASNPAQSAQARPDARAGSTFSCPGLAMAASTALAVPSDGARK